MHRTLLTIILAPWLLTACGDGDKDPDKDTATNDTASGTDLLCSEPEAPACFDQMYQELSLHDDKVSDGDVTTVADGDDFVTVIDATAGGMYSAADNPWVYVRFDETGASRVDIDDDTATSESMDWHLALRRYFIRLNGGDGGPSCVGGYGMGSFDYDEIDAVPSGVEFDLEDFYTDDCVIIEDNSGLGDLSPRFVMDGWWSYLDCVETTFKPFLIQTETGQVFKLVVETYYESGQEACNAGGGMGSGQNGGVIKIRWQFLE